MLYIIKIWLSEAEEMLKEDKECQEELWEVVLGHVTGGAEAAERDGAAIA